MTDSTTATGETTQLKRSLGLFSAITMVSGIMIGSGIFIVSADIARQLGTPSLLLANWVFVGLVTLFAAISYSHLAKIFPDAGGQYVYLKKLWGPCLGFLYGWALFFVIQSGTIAAVAVAFGKFLGVLWPWVSSQNILFNLPFGWVFSTQQLMAVLVIVGLTAYNCMGVQQGAILQNVFTVLKVAALLGLIAVGGWVFMTGQAQPIHWTSFELPQELSKDHTLPLLSAFAVASVGSLFSADAWNNVTFIGSEIKEPEKNLPKALVYGTLTVLVLYILANWAFVTLLPFDAIQHAPEDRVATAALNHIWGSSGAAIMALVILVSTFGCLNGMILAGARVTYAMAKDSLFFKAFEHINTTWQTPVTSLVGQGIWAGLLTLSGSYGQLLDYTMFTTILFYLLTIVGMFVYAKKHPDHLKLPLFTGWIIPLAYLVLATYLTLHLAIYKPGYTIPGLAIVAAGIPIYGIWQKFKAKTAVLNP